MVGMLDVVLQGAATVAALNLNLTPLRTGLRLRREQKSEPRLPCLPFSTIMMNCAVWTVYGFMLGNWFPLVVSNSVGCFAGVFCLYQYHAVGTLQQKHSAKLHMLAITTVLLLLLAYTRPVLAHIRSAGYAPASHPLVQRIGQLGMMFGIVMFASPLGTLKEVLNRWNSDSIPLDVCVAQLMCSFLWSIYGVKVSDPYIFLPNCIGLALNLVQIVLIQYIGATSTMGTKALPENVDETYGRLRV